jgi:hypothetical protein
MRFMLMHYSNEDNEAGVPPSPELMAAMGPYMAETAKSGALVSAEGLDASSLGARLTIEDGKESVLDGPFAKPEELIAGFAILDLDSKDAALDHARQFAKISGATKIDIRRIKEF